jgi:hypothetical protein
MKDFQIHFFGNHEDLKKIVDVGKAVVEEVRAAGGEIEGFFSSGHLLGGSRHLDNVGEGNPLTFSDGSMHPEPPPDSNPPAENV